MKLIAITRDRVVVVDDADYADISKYNWSAVSANNTDYAVRKGRRHTGEPRTVSMHRQIMGSPKSAQIDHINGNGLDNRRSNLRVANTQTNAFNRKKPLVTSTSRYKGVLRRKGKSVWEVRVKYNNKAIHLGMFKLEEDAASAYNYGAMLMYGEFARINEGVPEPPQNIKWAIYERCYNQVKKRGWHPETGAFVMPSHPDLERQKTQKEVEPA